MTIFTVTAVKGDYDTDFAIHIAVTVGRLDFVCPSVLVSGAGDRDSCDRSYGLCFGMCLGLCIGYGHLVYGARKYAAVLNVPMQCQILDIAGQTDPSVLWPCMWLCWFLQLYE